MVNALNFTMINLLGYHQIRFHRPLHTPAMFVVYSEYRKLLSARESDRGNFFYRSVNTAKKS